jgi:hypothetical protein
MQRYYAASQIVISASFKADLLQHVQQRLLIRMHANGFGQIPITLFVIRDEFAHERQDPE